MIGSIGSVGGNTDPVLISEHSRHRRAPKEPLTPYQPQTDTVQLSSQARAQGVDTDGDGDGH